MTYKEQLQTDEWKAKRLEILERDGKCCTKCDKTTYLHVHHTYYEDNKFAWEYPNEALITLCKGCHYKFHKTHMLNIPSKPASFTLFDKYLDSLWCLQGSELSVFLYLCNKAEVDTNKISITAKTREDLRHYLGLSISTVSKSLSVLNKKHYLIGERAEFIVNPAIMWKGDLSIRAKLLSTHVNITKPSYHTI